MLLEMHHWDYPALNDTDIDDLLAYIVYYPQWKKNSSKAAGQPNVQRVYADQVNL